VTFNTFAARANFPWCYSWTIVELK